MNSLSIELLLLVMTDMTTSSPGAPHGGKSAVSFGSNLTEQFRQRREESRLMEQSQSGSDTASQQPPRLLLKSRSLSDSSRHNSPIQLRGLSRASKDDISVGSQPATPPKSHPSLRGLSLHLPPKPYATLESSPLIHRAPLSPKLDVAHIYGSPASVLPRRSRGLDFSRACTNLHHSTLADSSPDSSPTIGGRGVTIPQRRGTAMSWIGSPGAVFNQQLSTSGAADRATISSSVSSVNMLDSDTTSSEEDDDEPMNGDRDDLMITATPQANKFGGGLANAPTQSPGNDWMGIYSPAASTFASFQRARFRNRRSRHSSSSASGNSSKPSPGPLSPPVLKSIETSGGGYFSRDMSKNAVQSRRESLSLGTRDLHLSDFSDDGESRVTRCASPAIQSNPEGGARGVIRRVVTRRGNLLPKTKNFARIRAALLEESAPLDSEAKREAEVIRQVRESDPTVQLDTPVLPEDSLPLSAAVAVTSEVTLISPEDAAVITNEATSDSSFSNHASQNSGGVAFWNSFDGRYRTPPPIARVGGVPGEDTVLDTPQPTAAAAHISKSLGHARSRSPALQAACPPLVTEFRRKRRRDDDLDPESFKRRAVSPGMSVQSSPVMSQSPMVKDGNSRALQKATPGPFSLERDTNSSGSSNGHTGSIKRVGLQGMNETNDGLMNMSIE
ncbi:hypothetical protein V8E54_001116 [Elaphomyces granulatus]